MTSSITLFETFTSIGIAPEQARAAVAALESERTQAFEVQSKQLASKESQAAFQVDFNGKLEALRTDMHKSHADLLKWVVTVVLATFAALITIYKLEV